MGAMINFLLNIVLIKNFASLGASIATVIAEGTVFAVQMYMIRKEFNLWDIIKWSKNAIISSIVMFVVAYLVGTLFANQLIGMSIQIIVGIIIYFLMLILLKDAFLKQLLEKLATKITFLDRFINFAWK